jgi:hypothetical protein
MFGGAVQSLDLNVPIGDETPDLGSVRAVGDASPNWDLARLRKGQPRDACVHTHTVS